MMLKIGKVAERKTHRAQIRLSTFERDFPFSLNDDAVSHMKAHMEMDRKL